MLICSLKKTSYTITFGYLVIKKQILENTIKIYIHVHF